MWLGFDPGRDKCGVAVVGEDGVVQFHVVVAASEAIPQLQELVKTHPIQGVVMGNQTTSKQWKAQLEGVLSVPIYLVDERNSSLEARDRYWQMYPPRGLQRLLPQGLRLPPRPVDDIVAILLVERYLRML
ncbi:pre-16S rRNA-processing nuclease YqgF [Spirulina sp. CS-785/01]|uniref:pre-16S rRNA-processing nuclease YqgF n=1 Tax=Spirulina sp. CS-785/01 TaxID=3021716 RepID=UPI00232DEE55|nr:pre-16S rRNA-processing nuclease YqgF [Spirulina sp. CS-785/01]MDB9316000.1 pre-16S rRNA-processing nuclease YqgF [Spirulina sp. CS-785/01]